MPEQNIKRFQESITQELTLIQNRVRDLIGDANWSEDGRYKEAILRKIISQFLPSNLRIGTGFILGDNGDLSNSKISSQLDIIIYQDNSSPIFKEGDFIIITEKYVRAIIEVKTKIINFATSADNSLNAIISKFERLRQFHSFVPGYSENKVFIGIFSFEYDSDFLSTRVDESLIISSGLINHLSLGPNKFIKYWSSTVGLTPPLKYNGKCYIRYNLLSLSFSYFISNLIHIVSDEDPTDRYWVSFPIVGTKEQHREGAIVKIPNSNR